MKKEILPELLQKYLRGDASPEETEEVDAWYASLQENPDDISLLDPLESHFVQQKIFRRIKSNIDLPKVKKNPARNKNIFFLKTPFKLAAAITAIAVIGLGAIFFKQRGLPSFSHNQIATSEGVKRTTNNTDVVRRLMLEDGTVIILKPSSSIEYPHKFSGTERNVSLLGEAFFDVAREKDRPFFIHAANVTVKVLGTSFNVMAYEGAKEISVAVKTGKVSVYAKTKNTVTSQLKEDEEVILTPNQEAVYNTTNESFSKKLVSRPQIILEKPTLFETQYDGAPVVKILKELEKNYGVSIQYDEQLLGGCTLTTSMAEEGLYERIEIICKAIGATHELVGTNIVITTKGCR